VPNVPWVSPVRILLAILALSVVDTVEGLQQTGTALQRPCLFHTEERSKDLVCTYAAREFRFLRRHALRLEH
jgi:hypothetical protein